MATQTYGSTNPLLQKPTSPTWTAPMQGPVKPVVAPASVRVAPTVAPAPIAPPSPAPAPVATAPTPASVYGSDLNTYKTDDPYDSALTGMVNSSKTAADAVVSPELIYRSKLKQYQGEIDAVNQLYREKLRVENVAGQGRLGTGRAIQGRSGLLGSDFASAQNDQIGQNNTDVRSGIEGEQALAIATILGNARKDATEEATAKRAAKEQGAESYLKFLGEQSTRRSGKLDGFLATLGDTDLSKVSPTNLSEVAKSYGITVDELKTKAKALKDANAATAKEADLKARKGEADINKLNSDIANAGFFELSEGQSRYDAKGNVIASKGKTYAPSTPGAKGGIVDANGKAIKLTAGQVDTIFSFDNALSATEKSLNLLLTGTGVSTGPLASVIHQGKKFADRANPDTLQIEQTLSKLKADYMKALSGAAVSESEAKRLAKFLPDIGDQEGVLKSKLENLKDEIGTAKRNFTTTLGGMPTSGNTEDTPGVRAQAEKAGYDYDAMKADGLSDEEIAKSL